MKTCATLRTSRRIGSAKFVNITRVNTLVPAPNAKRELHRDVVGLSVSHCVKDARLLTPNLTTTERIGESREIQMTKVEMEMEIRVTHGTTLATHGIQADVEVMELPRRHRNQKGKQNTSALNRAQNQLFLL